MNRLKDVFEDLAHDAPPIGDLAQRAVSRARRRHWISFGGSVTAAGLAVAGVMAVALVVAGLPGASPPDNAPQSSTVPADSVLQHQPIKLPEDTPSPLPSGGVGPVALAYTLNCAGASDRPACASWRVLTVDGKHWRVSDAMGAGPWNRDGEGTEEKTWGQPSGLAVSPDGRSLAYFRGDGSFGIRDLATGKFRVAFRADGERVYWPAVSVVWSPGGDRLAVSYGLTGDLVTARVVDAGSMRVTDLPGACCVLGLPDGSGGAPVLMYDAAESDGRPNWSKLLVVGSDGDVLLMVPFDQPIALTDDVVRRYQWSRISPDGRSLAGLVDEEEGRPLGKDDDAPDYTPNPHLEVVTISATTGDVSGRHRVAELRGLGYTKVLGWSGRSELLAADLVGGGYDEARAIDPSYSGGEVYAVNVRTGATRKAVSFAGGGGPEPTLLSLATDLL